MTPAFTIKITDVQGPFESLGEAIAACGTATSKMAMRERTMIHSQGPYWVLTYHVENEK